MYKLNRWISSFADFTSPLSTSHTKRRYCECCQTDTVWIDMNWRNASYCLECRSQHSTKTPDDHVRQVKRREL